MPRVHFLNEAVTIDAPLGASLFQVARDARINLFEGFFKTYHCGGKGRCLGAGCKVWATPLEDGALEHPAPPRLRALLWRLRGSQVMACRAIVRGEVEIRTQPGALEVRTNMVWEPDPRPYAWKQRLVVEQKKKPPRPTAKSGAAKATARPKAGAAPKVDAKPAADAGAAPNAKAKPAADAGAAPKVEARPAADPGPAPKVEAKPAPDPGPAPKVEARSAADPGPAPNAEAADSATTAPPPAAAAEPSDPAASPEAATTKRSPAGATATDAGWDDEEHSK